MTLLFSDLNLSERKKFSEGGQFNKAVDNRHVLLTIFSCFADNDEDHHHHHHALHDDDDHNHAPDHHPLTVTNRQKHHKASSAPSVKVKKSRGKKAGCVDNISVNGQVNWPAQR